jgi:hypothetical protein
MVQREQYKPNRWSVKSLAGQSEHNFEAKITMSKELLASIAPITAMSGYSLTSTHSRRNCETMTMDCLWAGALPLSTSGMRWRQ